MKEFTVKSLFVRDAYNFTPRRVSHIVLESELGVLGDENMSIFSPRHVLLVSELVLKKHGIAPGGLRENITVSSNNYFRPPLGSLIKIGDCTILLTSENERCNIVQPLITKERGFYGIVLEGGIVNVGNQIDTVRTDIQIDSARRFDLFIKTIKQIPKGKILSYEQICIAIGGRRVHCRILPNFIKKAHKLNPNLPLHRIVDTKGALLSAYYENQKCKLMEESVFVDCGRVDLDRYKWIPQANIHRANNR